MTTPVSGAPAPLVEKGYASPQGSGTAAWWQSAEDETTPELRYPLDLVVYERMVRQDAQVRSVLRAVELPVRRTAWRLEPGPARPEVAALIAEDLGLPLVGEPLAPPSRSRDRFSWQEHLRLALRMLRYGHYPFEQVYRLDDQQRVRLRKLAPRPPRTLTGITVARDGGLVNIKQAAPLDGPAGGEVVIPVDRLVFYAHDREAGSWRGESLLRPAYKNWLLKDRLLRTWSQTIERNGMGVPVYSGPENPLDPEKDLAAGLALARQVRAGADAGAALPHGATLELLGVKGTLADANQAVRYHDEQIGRSVLAHFLNLDAKGGSYALASVQADTFTQSLQSLAQQIADVATQHVVEDLVELNYGPDEPAPRIVFDTIGGTVTAEALAALVAAGLIYPDRDLEQNLRGRLDLPLKAAAPFPPATQAAQAAQALQEQRQHELALERVRAQAVVDAARVQAEAQREQASAQVRAAELTADRPLASVTVQPAAAPDVHFAPAASHHHIDVHVPEPQVDVHVPVAPPRSVLKTVERDSNGDVVAVYEREA